MEGSSCDGPLAAVGVIVPVADSEILLRRDWEVDRCRAMILDMPATGGLTADVDVAPSAGAA